MEGVSFQKHKLGHLKRRLLSVGHDLACLPSFSMHPWPSRREGQTPSSLKSHLMVWSKPKSILHSK